MWFKVDDKLHDHRKARSAGSAPLGLWVLAGSWAADNITDGFVPESVCNRWDRSYKRLAAALVAAGLWHVAEKDGEKGWQFHEWEFWQPTREQIEKKRAEARERMANVRGHKKGSSQNVRANSERTDSEVPDQFALPRPDPTRPEPEVPNGTSVALARFDEFWEVFPKHVAKQAAQRKWVTAIKSGTDPQRIIDGARRYAQQMRGADAQFVKQPDGWLNAGRWEDEPAAAVGQTQSFLKPWER